MKSKNLTLNIISIYLILLLSSSCQVDQALIDAAKKSDPNDFFPAEPVPNRPQQVSLHHPQSINGSESNIQILVEGLAEPSDSSEPTLPKRVRLYNDENCTHEMASADVQQDQVLISLQLQNFGTHSFFATSENSKQQKSPCSSSSAFYVYEAPEAPSYLNNLQIHSPQSLSGITPSLSLSLQGVTYGHTIRLYTDASCTQMVGETVATSEDVEFDINLNSLGDYVFYVTSTNMFGTSSCEEVHSYSYGEIPSAPSTLALASSMRAIDVDSTPTLTISGVSQGDQVKVFSDSSCSQEMGSATSSDTSIDITTSPLSSFSVYTFYANTTNVFGTSECSVASVNYDFRDPSSYTPTIDVSQLAGIRSSFQDCGAIVGTIDEKIQQCSQINPGSIVDVGNGKLWKLVRKIGTAEVWLDDTYKMLWSPDRGKHYDHNATNSKCPATGSYDLPGISWRRVEQNDYVKGKSSLNWKVLSYHSSNLMWWQYIYHCSNAMIWSNGGEDGCASMASLRCISYL